MRSLFQRTSPFAQFVRWLTASIANFAHADHGFLVLYSTPVPPNVSGPFVIRTWGDLIQMLHVLLPSGAWQLTLAIITHIITVIMVLWWGIESYHSYKDAKHWLSSMKAKLVAKVKSVRAKSTR